jgi:threonine dehydrogenase-like Zn-dependent dehydrogenase
MKEEFETELSEIAPERPTDGNWKAGDAPSLVFTWALGALAKAGTLSIIGVYPETAKHFPIGMAMNKNLTLKAGNCDHRKYVPTLLDLVETGAVDPSKVLTKVEPLTSVLNAYQAFDTRQPGWIKVEIVPGMSAKREIQPWSFEPVTPRVQ